MTAGRMPRYRQTRRRLLIDMHIADWEMDFLARFRPGDLAAAADRTGADAVMLYFQSHLGLCYYPTKAGVRHRIARDRDMAGEALAALHSRGLPVCAYYSVNFNNRAWLDHPEWRLEPAAPATVGVLPRERYGILCLNNAEYRAFVDAQIAEIAAYPIDAFFFDMVWWNGICLCPACRRRYRDETAEEIPERIDWNMPGWNRFQAARERWLTELTVGLRAHVRSIRPDTDVYHNFALGMSNWTRGVTFDAVAGHDFLGGDFYGGRAEQMLITRLMLNLTPSRPAEFMTTVATGLVEHTRLRSVTQLRTKALAALAADAAFLAIIAIDPDGTIDAEALDRVRAAFATYGQYAALAGGRPIEEVGIYCSDFSKMDMGWTGRPISEAPAASIPDYPHFEALAGACRILQQAHVPFGVASRVNLDDLSRWPVLVLPNVQRLTSREVAAFQDYVRDGGRLYASRATSLHGIGAGGADSGGKDSGGKDSGGPGQFQLAELFGCRFEGEEGGRLVYARSLGRPAFSRPLAHWHRADGKTGTVRISLAGGEPIVALTLPYGHPRPGSVTDCDWASIHSSPPWQDTQNPLVVRNRYGRGLSIYSAFDIEAGQSPEHDSLFLQLIRELLPEPPMVAVATHPHVWLSAFDQNDRIVLFLLNYQLDEPPLAVGTAEVTIRVPAGRRCTGIRRAPDMMAIRYREIDSRTVMFEAGPVELVSVYVVDLAGSGLAD